MTAGFWTLKRVLLIGRRSIQVNKSSLESEFTIQRLFAAKEVQMEWLWFMEEDQMISLLLTILGDWEDIEMEDGIGSRLHRKQIKISLLEDTSILVVL